MPRCCPSHVAWDTLADHLIDEFPELTMRTVLRELLHGREAVNTAGLSGLEAIETAELIARHQLLLLSGRSLDVARLDPQPHHRL